MHHAFLDLFCISGGFRGADDPPDAIGGNIIYGAGTRQTRCSGCDRFRYSHIDWEGSGVFIFGDTALDFHDWIHSTDGLIASEKAVNDMLRAGFGGFKVHTINSLSIEAERLKDRKPPKYFLIEAPRGIEIDRATFDEFDGDLCPVCFGWRPREGGKHRFGEKVKIPLSETWNGSDIVKISNVSMGPFYCSRRLAEFGAKMKWYSWGVSPFTWGLPQIDLKDPAWLDELATAVSARFPQWESGRKNGQVIDLWNRSMPGFWI